MMGVSYFCEDSARTGDQLRPMLCIVRAPGAVRVIPALPGQPCGAINLIPVRGIIFFKFREPPRDAHLLKHRQIRGGVGVVGIDQRAVPVEEHSFNGVFGFGKHGSTEYQKGGEGRIMTLGDRGREELRSSLIKTSAKYSNLDYCADFS